MLIWCNSRGVFYLSKYLNHNIHICFFNSFSLSSIMENKKIEIKSLFVERVGFEPLLFRARELCYHYTTRPLLNFHTALKMYTYSLSYYSFKLIVAAARVELALQGWKPWVLTDRRNRHFILLRYPDSNWNPLIQSQEYSTIVLYRNVKNKHNKPLLQHPYPRNQAY